MRKVNYLITLLLVPVLVLSVGLTSSLAAEKVVVNLADSPPYTEGSPMCEFAVKFKELAAAYSNGKIDVQIFWGGALGTEQKVFKDAQIGTVQAVLANIANLAPFASALYTVNLPYIFDSREEAYMLFRGSLGDYFEEQTVKLAGLRVLAWPDQAGRVLHNTKRSVQSIGDMKGLKWRVPNNPVFIAEYKSWGVNPIPMPWGEVFSSLQTGVIHGGDNVLRNLIDFKMYQMEKYVTVTNHMLEIVPLVVGETWFKSQPKEIQDALVDAASDAWAWEYFAMKDDVEYVKGALRAEGMVIDEPDTTAWKEAAVEIWPQFYDKAGGKEIFDKVVSFKKAR